MTTSRMTTSTAPPGRAEQFAACYQTAYDDLLRFVRRRVHPSHAEDVVAEVFLVAWRRFDDRPAAADEVRPWLFGIARRTLANARRGAERREALAVRIAEAGDLESPARAAVLDADLIARRLDVADAWRRLRPADQEALALTVWDGLTGQQAASVLEISHTAYRLRLSRARKALRAELDAGPAPATTLTRTATPAQEGPLT